jgi:DNA-binding transcriptional LysR family regulator
MDKIILYYNIGYLILIVRIFYIMIDRLRQMAIFSKVIDHGSFRKAAAELRLSPSVISHHISQLEDHLGVALIYRSTRKLNLTKDGEKLLATTRKMLDAVEGELHQLTSSAQTPSGKLNITLPSVLSQSHFVDKIALFSNRYPHVELSLDFSDEQRDLIKSGFDFAIRMGPKPKKSATSKTLFKVEIQLIASTSFLEQNGSIASPKDLSTCNWLSLSPVQDGPIKFKHTNGHFVTINPDRKIFTNDAQALYRLAYAGAGLAFVPDFLTKEHVTSGNMVCVLPEWHLPGIDVYAVWPSNAPKHGLIHLALKSFTY